MRYIHILKFTCIPCRVYKYHILIDCYFLLFYIKIFSLLMNLELAFTLVSLILVVSAGPLVVVLLSARGGNL